MKNTSARRCGNVPDLFILPFGIPVALVFVLAWGGLGRISKLQGSTPVRRPAPRMQYPVQALESPEPGTFLVAARGMLDPNFGRSVVFLIDYDSDGAFGLIINRPSRHSLSELWPEITGLEQHTVFIGGPVVPDRLLFLVRSESGREGMRQVIRGVQLGSDELELKTIIAEGEKEFRTYAGYAGWAPGQLDAEVERGDWHILPAQRRFIFAAPPDGVWNELIQRVDTRVARLRA